jgi:hypothetical protein
MYKRPPHVVGSTFVSFRSHGSSFIQGKCFTFLHSHRIQRCWHQINESRAFVPRPPRVEISLAWRLRAFEDPLQDALYNTWGEASEDWGVEEYTDEQLIDILYEVCAKQGFISLGFSKYGTQGHFSARWKLANCILAYMHDSTVMLLHPPV